MPRIIKAADVANTDIVTEPNPTTNIPNDVVVDVKPQIEEPELDSPVVIPDAVAKDILKTEDDVKVVEVEEPAPKTGTCNLCGKTMLLNNLKYAHPKVCKNSPPPEAPPPPPPSIEQVETIIAKRIKEVITKPTIEDLKTKSRSKKTKNKKSN